MSGFAIAALVAAATVAVGVAARRAERAARDDVIGVVAPSSSRSALHLDERIAFALVGCLGGFAVGGVVGALLGAPAGLVCARIRSRRRRTRGRELLEEQLVDAVAALSAALRAGLSLSRAIGYAAEEVEPPLADLLRATSDRIQLGANLDDALDRFADEVGGRDVRLLNGVLALHRRTGGDLPRVLDQVAVTLRERRASVREVRALTAQARLSGAILGFLPIAFFLFLAVTSRRDIEAAFTTPAGLTAMVVGLTMQACAFVWIRKLLRVS